LTNDNTSGSYFIPFSKTATTSNALYIDNTTGPLTYNPSTSNLSATTFTGSFSGTSTSSTTITITDDDSATVSYLVFATAAGTNTSLFIDSITSPMSYVPSTGTLTVPSISSQLIDVGDVEILPTSITVSDTSGNLKNTSITPYQIEVRDEINGPLGDPVITQISPGQIYMENQNNTQETLTISVPVINLTNTNTGFVNDITPSGITIQDTAANNVGSFSNLDVSISDTVLGLSTVMSAGAITATNWLVDATGKATLDTLTVNSIALVTTLSLTGTTLNINLGSFAISNSYTITINNNVTTLVPTNGISGGVYKLWLTVGATPRTFSKACGVINNLLGDTVMAAGSIWLIEIYRRASSTYRAVFTNFT
jgi:hypothetical protein